VRVTVHPVAPRSSRNGSASKARSGASTPAPATSPRTSRRAASAAGAAQHLDEALATVAGRVEADGLLVAEPGADALLSVAEQRGASLIAVGATDRDRRRARSSVPCRTASSTRRGSRCIVPPG
jgi:nucleotide-binding universal stress UspA family protein